jgi:thiol:disulfide interchange protein
MLLFMAAMTGMGGCQRAPAGAPKPITTLEPSQVARRGSLDFVRGWELGRRVAAERGRPCLVFFTAHWCTYCRRMEATTFNDPAVVQSAHEFLCILVDADQEPEICRRLQVSGYPTVELISTSGASLGRLTGWQSPASMMHSLQAALHRYAWLEGSVRK